MIDVFRALDTSGDSLISRDEFRYGLLQLGVQAEPADADVIFEEWDAAGPAMRSR